METKKVNEALSKGAEAHAQTHVNANKRAHCQGSNEAGPRGTTHRAAWFRDVSERIRTGGK